MKIKLYVGYWNYTLKNDNSQKKTAKIEIVKKRPTIDIRNYELGLRMPSIEKLAKIYKCNPAYFGVV